MQDQTLEAPGNAPKLKGIKHFPEPFSIKAAAAVRCGGGRPSAVAGRLVSGLAGGRADGSGVRAARSDTTCFSKNGAMLRATMKLPIVCTEPRERESQLHARSPAVTAATPRLIGEGRGSPSAGCTPNKRAPNSSAGSTPNTQKMFEAQPLPVATYQFVARNA
jgi:hypothetical protein